MKHIIVGYPGGTMILASEPAVEREVAPNPWLTEHNGKKAYWKKSRP